MPPKSQHFVLFFKIKIGHLKAEEIPLKLQRSETDGAIWLGSDNLRNVIAKEGQGQLIEGYVLKKLSDG